MQDKPYYLKPNIVAEPLFNQWYAWSYLISPASAAMIVSNLHIPLMKSFISAPQVHAAAARNPALLGGKFVGLPAEKTTEIGDLLEKTVAEQQELISLASAIKELDAVILNEAKGYSLEDLYGKVPEPLRGYVELVYDLNNQPYMRLIEGLLYKSRYYDETRQSFSLYKVERDERPFSLSTPRLPTAGTVQVQTPFRSQAVDMLFSMKDVPLSFESIKEALRLEDQYDDLFLSFLTTTPPPPKQRYTGPGVRVRYYGHAAILLETSEVSVLVDPVISYQYPNGLSRYTYEDLPETIDYVLLTHNHQDHVLLETLLQLRHRIGRIVVPRSCGGGLQDPSLKLMFQHLGFKDVIELGELEVCKIEGGEIIGVPFIGEHSDIDVRSKIAHFVRLKEKAFLLAADSCNLAPELYSHVHKAVGDVDVLFIGMECDGGPLSWLYSPLLTRPLSRAMDQSRRLNGSDFSQAMKIVDEFSAKQAYVYAMGQEPWTNYIMSIAYTEKSRPITESNQFVHACRERGMSAERLYASKEFFV